MITEKPSGSKDLSGVQSIPYRWVMLGLLWLLYASFGIVYRSISPLITPIVEELHMSYSQMGLVLGSWQLTYIAVAAIAGVVIDRWGIRKSLFFGAIMIALSAGLRYFTKGFETFLPIVALFGIGGPMISIGCPKTIALWFRGKDRGTAVGIYMTGPWIGGAFVLAATNTVFMPLTGYNWRLTFALYGALTLGVALLWWFLAREMGPMEEAEGFEIRMLFMRLLKVRNVRIVLISGLLSFCIIHGLTNWLPKILETRGLSPTLAGLASSTPLLASIPALLILPRAVPPHLRGRVIALIALLTGAAAWVLVNSSGFLMYVGLVIFGASGCSVVPLLTLILMETPEVGSRYMGSAGGIFFCVSEIGGFMGPLAMGTLVDWTGTFLSGAYFVAGIGLCIFGLALLLENAPLSETRHLKPET